VAPDAPIFGGGPFGAVFEQSRIPMALLDRHHYYVAVNDALLDLFQCRREDMIGRRAGRSVIGARASVRSEPWDQLLATGELYGERVVTYPNRPSMRVSYAAHAIDVNGQWRALFVTLSARVEPGGAELIGTSRPATHSLSSAELTPREHEVVRRVALGATTRRIASDLFLSPATVRSHIRNAMSKTNAHTRAQLVAIVLGDVLTTGGRPE
jgi:DNA-binding CsgD family transcriptional regulator